VNSAGQSRVVIIGAGHAGGSVATQLRQFDFKGDIVVIGAEKVAPYQRPPLSKAYLKGDADVESLKLRLDKFYADNGITLRLETKAIRIDRQAKRVEIEGGGSEPYDYLVIATGSRARKLPIPGVDLKHVHELRTVADADDLKAAVAPGKHIAIIGGGYVGLEVAASARALGAQATIIERESRCLARVACEQLSSFFEKFHREQGVEILTGASVSRLIGDTNGALSAVEVNGKAIPCQAAVVGVGAVACDELAREAGLPCENGIVVDTAARTSDPHIFAVGDVTWRPMPLYDNRMFRLESVPNALEQAKQVASAITGRSQPPPEVPWFWSDQYSLKLQIAGVPFDADQIVVRGDPATAKFAVFHLKAGRVLAVEAVNAPPEFVVGKQMIANKTVVDPVKLQDSSLNMRQLAA
jgi:3-phenylpropionate/trans-cinnamate dioxygenase ferredoxin reductase subunit